MSESDGDRTTEEEISDLVGNEIVRDRDEREQLLVEIPSSMKDILDKRSEQTGKPKWLIVTEAIARTEGGSDLDTIPQIEQAIERKEQRAADLEAEAEVKLDQAQDHRDRAETLRRRKAKIKRKTQDRIDALDDVLDTMADCRMHADIGVGPVPQLAEQWFDGDEHEAVSTLKSRAAEINVEIPPEQFSAPGADAASTNGSATASDDEPDLKSLQRLRNEIDGERDDGQNQDQDQNRESDPNGSDGSDEQREPADETAGVEADRDLDQRREHEHDHDNEAIPIRADGSGSRTGDGGDGR